MRNLLPALLIGLILACGMLTSCKKHINGPPDDTSHKCDTCCDTCKKDTTKPPCDTCNINKDSAAHAFVWTEFIDKIPGEANLTGVWVFGPNDIMICGNSLWHFDGTNFTLIDESLTRHPTISANGALNGNIIFAFGKTDFWLVRGIAYHSTDANHIDDMRPPGFLNACWGTKSSDMFFVGNAGYIYHYDGTSFTQMNSGTTKDIGQIWGTSSTNVWASGWNPSTAASVLLHYNGSTWSEIDLSKLGDIGVGKSALIGVWACDSSNKHITVTCGSFIYRTTDNNLWRSDTLKNSLGGGSYSALDQIRGNSSTDFMVQGSGGYLSHWNGKTWFFYNQFYDYSAPDYDINALSFNGNTAAMVGFKNGQAYLLVGHRK